MAKGVETIVASFKSIIDKNGPGFLEDEPYRVYIELVKSGTDRKTAAAILHFLVSGALKEADTDSEFEGLSKSIQKVCSLNKKMSDRLAAIFLSLYTNENKEEWEGRHLEGAKQFLHEEFVFKWKGFSVWDEGNGTVDCQYEAEIILRPTKAILNDEELGDLLQKNPFTEKEIIHDLFEKRLCKYLDYEFEEYCTEDDYYQPVVEDFEIDYRVEDWSKKNGFEFVSCDGSGDDGGYEPKFRRGWY